MDDEKTRQTKFIHNKNIVEEWIKFYNKNNKNEQLVIIKRHFIDFDKLLSVPKLNSISYGIKIKKHLDVLNYEGLLFENHIKLLDIEELKSDYLDDNFMRTLLINEEYNQKKNKDSVYLESQSSLYADGMLRVLKDLKGEKSNIAYRHSYNISNEILKEGYIDNENKDNVNKNIDKCKILQDWLKAYNSIEKNDKIKLKYIEKYTDNDRGAHKDNFLWHLGVSKGQKVCTLKVIE